MIKPLLQIDIQEQTVCFDTSIRGDQEFEAVSSLKAIADAVVGEQQEAVLEGIIASKVIFQNSAIEDSLWKNHQLRRW